MTSIRIGSPPSAPQQPKRREGPYVLAVAIVLLLAATGAILGVVLRNQQQRRAAPPSASPSERAPGSALGELETCLALVPLLRKSADEMAAFNGEPMRKADDMAATAAALRALEPKAPEAWQPDIAVQYAALQKIADVKGDPAAIYQLHLDLAGWGEAGQRLAHGCLPYATS